MTSQTNRLVIAILACSILIPAISKGEETVVVQAQLDFILPSGESAETLRSFAIQSGQSLIYDLDEVKGIQTNGVEGFMEPSEALELMLKDTPLGFIQDVESGAFAIVHLDPQNAAKPTDQQGGTPDGSDNENLTQQADIDMNDSKSKIRKLIAGLLSVVATTAPPSASGQEETAGENVYELSPFVIQGTGESYTATSTLAGTRLKTDVADVGSSITIVTEKLMDDLSATDASSILTYTANTEVGGVLGTYSASAANNVNAGFDDNDARVAPQSAQRVRGLVSAELTRNFFRTSIPMDAYNTSSLTINRGPNSVLFGLGSPGGIIENSINAPILGEEFTELSVRLSHFGGHRETLDHNRSFFDDRLGIRINLLNADEKYEQEEAFREDRRLFLSFDGLLNEGGEGFFGSTRLRGNFEVGEIDSNPPILMPPTIIYNDWWNNDRALAVVGKHATIPTYDSLEELWRPEDTDGDGRFYKPQHIMDNTRTFDAEGNEISGLAFNQFPTVMAFTRMMQVYPSNNGQTDFFGLDAYTPTANYPNPRGTMHMRVANNGLNRYSGFTSPSLMNRSTFDYQNHLFTGDLNLVTHDFNVSEVALEQLMLDGNLGLEIGFNKQDYERFSFTPWASGNSRRISIDIGKYTPVPETLPHTARAATVPLRLNPNVTRPTMVNGAYNEDYDETNTETMRATAFFKHDFQESVGEWGKWLGNHTITALYEEYEETSPFHRMTLKVNSDEVDAFSGAVLRNDFRSGNTNAVSQVFLGPASLPLSGADQVVLDLPIRVPVPEANTSFQGYYWDNAAKQLTSASFYHTWANTSQDISQRNVTSEAAVIQSRWLEDNLITLFAWRDDGVESYEMVNAGRERNGDGSYDLSKRRLSSTAASDISGDTFTQSYVLNFPEEWLFELPGDTDFRVHYFESESFEPTAVGRNIWGDVVSNPTGTTKEYGFSMDLINRRLSLRVNKYETSSSNARTDANGAIGNVQFWHGEVGNNGFLSRIADAEAAGWTVDDPEWPSQNTGGLTPPDFGFNSFEEIYAGYLNAIPEATRNLWNHQIDRTTGFVEATPIEGLTATFDFVSEGTEVELIGAVTDNWNIVFNIAQQETIQDNTATELKRWIDEVYANFQQSQILFGIGPTANQSRSGTSFMSTTSVFNVNSAVAQNGVIAPEQREWRWNLINSYSFNEGPLNGFTVGAVARWQDEVAIGNPVILNETGNAVKDVLNPYFGDSEFNADLWFAYRTKIWNDIDWKIQLNIRNLIGGDDEIPVAIDPIGRISSIRIPVEQQFLLTNTFKF